MGIGIRKWLTNLAKTKPTRLPSPPGSARLEEQVLRDIRRSIGRDTEVSENENPKQKRENHFVIDTEKETFTVIIYLEKEPATSLGTLEMAKDAIKNVYVQKAMKKSTEGILVPKSNGQGGIHAI